MLFTDGTILTIQDLREHDNFVLDVASTESIDLGTKLAIAQREIGYEITSFLLTRCADADLDRVVVTAQLRDLLATHTLGIVYRDAYNMHLNDRYLGRWKEFTRATERGLLRYLKNGVGRAGVNVPQAALPTATTASEGGLAAGMYYVRTAWQHIAGTVGEKSAALLVDSTGGSLSIDPGPAPTNAIGWHVFVGIDDLATRRQNENSIAPNTTWTQAAALRQDLRGPEASGPDYFVRRLGQLSRG